MKNLTIKEIMKRHDLSNETLATDLGYSSYNSLKATTKSKEYFRPALEKYYNMGANYQKQIYDMKIQRYKKVLSDLVSQLEAKQKELDQG